jgi:hypothetical protein
VAENVISKKHVSTVIMSMNGTTLRLTFDDFLPPP